MYSIAHASTAHVYISHVLFKHTNLSNFPYMSAYQSRETPQLHISSQGNPNALSLFRPAGFGWQQNFSRAHESETTSVAKPCSSVNCVVVYRLI